MSRRIALSVLLAPLLLALLLATGGWWVLETASGSRWLWERIAGAVPGELSAESVEGALADRFRARGVLYRHDGLRVEITAAAFSLTPGWLPPGAVLSDLQIGDVTVRSPEPPPAPDTGGVSLRQILSLLRLPVPVRVDTGTLDSLRVLSYEEREIFALQSLRINGELHDGLELQQAGVSLAGFRLEATGSLGLAAPNAVDAALRVHLEPDALGRFPGTPLVVDAILKGDLDDLQLTLSSDAPSVQIAGNVQQVLEDPRWDLRLQSGDLSWPFEDPSPPVRARDVELRSRGRLRDYRIEGSSIVGVRDLPPATVAVVAGGDTTGLDLDELQLSGDELEAAGRGRLDWSSGFAVAADLDIARFDPHAFLPAWPADKPVSGSIDAAWRAGGIQLSALELNVQDASAAIEANGTIDAGDGTVDLAVDWRGLSWPLDAAPRVRSDTGRVRLAGRLDEWLVDGRLELGFDDFPDGSFVLRGEGDREQVAVTLSESALLGGSAAGRVQYNWEEGGQFSAALDARDIHSEPLAPEWPGVLSGRFEVTGRVRPFAVDLELRDLDGTLRGLPVTGGGGIRYAPSELSFRQFGVVSGPSSVTVNGNLREASGIDFDLKVAALDDFLPAAGGEIAARGNVSIAGGFPRLGIALEGRGLAWEQHRVEGLAVSSREGGPEPVNLDIQAQAIEIAGRELEMMRLRIAAGSEAQRVAVEATSDIAEFAFAFEGAFDDWRRPLTSTWNGRLTSVTLDAGEELRLSLAAPAALELALDDAAIERACLSGAGALEICAEGRWSGTGDFRAAAELSALPVNALGMMVDTGLDFTQTVDGVMSFSRAPGRSLSGDVRLEISGGRIRNRLDSRLETTTRPGRLRMQLDDGRLLSGQVNLPFSQASEIDAEFEVLDVALGEASRVRGQLQLDVADIGVAANVAPMIDAAAGRLEADMQMSGTLGAPRFVGSGSLRDGSLTYQPLGLVLRDMQLRADIKEQNRLELEGTFRAGDGRGRLYTSADYAAGRQTGLRVSLSGENLTLVDVPDVRVVANPELEFGWQDQTVTINGRVLVPQARLSPGSLIANPARESDDVVVVAGGDETAEERPADGPGIAINGAVELALGDDIVIDLDIADARVSGQATFRWNGPVMPVADGQYQIAGNVQAYGQLLQITEGLVNFNNGPADNPLLRLRAEREIFGNSQVRSAGVFVSGTAKDPEIDIYTNPATTESRALSLLVTGSDFNFEQGVGGVDVGTYIAPKLYLSYGIGLFDRENVISLRYDLAKGFGIKASSSARTDGVDLSYTIER